MALEWALAGMFTYMASQMLTPGEAEGAWGKPGAEEALALSLARCCLLVVVLFVAVRILVVRGLVNVHGIIVIV